jgi:AcrR family transcriptional regulator
MNTVYYFWIKIDYMSIKERRERDKEEMRAKILDSAHKLFIDKGFEEVSIRNIAEAIEYSPATIYLYFKDKDEIFYVIHQEAFRRYNEFNSALPGIADPFQRLVSMGERYMEFSQRFPQYYNIMFLTESPMHCYDNTEEWKEGAIAHSFLESTVIECIEAGYLKKVDPKVLALTIWSYMHGICSLSIRERMKIYPEEMRGPLMKDSFELFVKLLTK